MDIALGDVLEWKYGLVADTKQKKKGDKSRNPDMYISEWRHPTIPKPDQDQIDADIQEYKNHLKSVKYKKLRAKEYPPIQDQLDAIWKGGQAEADMREAINSVKDKYPKPEA